MGKPKCKLSGRDGNIFNLIGIAKAALVKAGQKEEAKFLVDDILKKAHSYDESLQIIMNYVEVE